MTATHRAIRADLDRVIQTGPAHLRPIYRAVRDHGCGHAFIVQCAGPFRLPTNKPLIAVIGDDLDTAIGPSGFDAPSLTRLLAASFSCAVISSSIVPEIYAAAASAASTLRKNTVIIETRLEQEQAWLDFIAQARPNLPTIVSTVTPMGHA